MPSIEWIFLMWAWKSVSCWMNPDEITTTFAFCGKLNLKDGSLIRIPLDDWTAYRYRWAVTKIRRIPPSLDMDFLLVELFLKRGCLHHQDISLHIKESEGLTLSDDFPVWTTIFVVYVFLVSGRTAAGFKAHHPGYDTSVWLGVWIFGNWLGHFEACLVLLAVWYFWYCAHICLGTV